MRELERFGVGTFTRDEVAAKAAFIKDLMVKREAPSAPFLSVILPAHREEEYILATLRSLAEQTYLNCEFLVISNGEPEGNPTQAIATACGFRVFHTLEGGIARARQVGLELARGEVIVTTDADTIHHPEWLTRIAHIMSDEQVPCGAGLASSLSRVPSVRWVQGFSALTMRVKDAISPSLVTGVYEATSFFRRDLAIACGGYDPLVRVGEGIVLFNHFRKPTVHIIYTDEPLIVYVSGRRQERQGAGTWLLIAFWNTLLQLVGNRGVSYETYPDIR